LKHLLSEAKQEVWTDLADQLIVSHDHMLSADARARNAQQRMRHWMQSRLSPMRGPLEEDAKVDAPRVEVVRKLARDGYSIEHLLIESHKGMRIPAHMYVPDEVAFSPPYAGVLVPCGHAYEGKAHIPYQIAGAAFARHGMVALVFDPLDQGERIQAPKDDASRQQHWGTTSHNITGAQARLLGWSQAGLEAFDGERCLSALAARPEVDPDRLGICGQSGGGTQTAQLFAVDARLKAAAPACYITNLTALTDTIGPQDEEQNLYGQAYEGLDHAAYLTVRAPAPVLICAAQDDFFSIEGTRATFEEVRAVYREFGAEDKAQMVVSPGGHNWGRELVSATVAFFAKELDGREIEVNWSDAVPMTTEEAQVTPRGHVVWMPGERTIYELLLDEAARAQQEASEPDRTIWDSGPSFPRGFGNLRDGLGPILLHKQLKGSKEWVPMLTPGKARAREAWLSSDGLVAIVAADRIDENEEADPEIAWLVIGAGAGSSSRPAQAPGSVHYFDPICTGELTPTDRPWYGSFGPAGTAGAYSVLSGRSLLGRQVEQILEYARTIQGRPRLVASGLPALAAAHAYAITPTLFDQEHSIELPFESWLDLFGYDAERNALAYVVHDALRYYDLSDLLPKAK
jgi:dienelactone hydrolase